MSRGRSRGPYGGRRQGLTGNQMKILGIVAILIDNIGAVVIQGGILHGTDSALYHGVLLTPSGHYWVIAGQVCRYVGRLGFPILAYLTTEEFVRTRDRRWYAVRMLLFALLSEVPFDLAVYHTMFYPHYQNMMFTLFTGYWLWLSWSPPEIRVCRQEPWQRDARCHGCCSLITMWWESCS